MIALVVVLALGAFALWLCAPTISDSFVAFIGWLIRLVILLVIISVPFVLIYIAWKVS